MSEWLEKAQFINEHLPISIMLDLLNIKNDGESVLDTCPICGDKITMDRGQLVSHSQIKNSNKPLCAKTLEKIEMAKDPIGLLQHLNVNFSIDKLLALTARMYQAGDSATTIIRKKKDYTKTLYLDLTTMGITIQKKNYQYFSDRGISKETVDNLPLGGTNSIPMVYFTREGKIFGGNRPAIKREFYGGSKVPFNGDRLFEEHEYLFITEGWADAATIEELGGKAIAINGIGSASIVANEIRLIDHQETTYIALFDCDKNQSGQRAEKSFVKGLIENGARVITADLENFVNSSTDLTRILNGSNKIDLNDILQYDRAVAIEFLQGIVEKSKEKLRETRRKVNGF